MSALLTSKWIGGPRQGGHGRSLPRLNPDDSGLQQLRDSFFATGSADPRAISEAGVDPQLIESWRRSMSFGIPSRRGKPVVRPEVELDTPLSRIADSVIMERISQLEQSMCALSLTDSEGTVLRQWIPDPALDRWLEQRNITPSVSVDETAIGTSSGICLLNEQPTMVRGLEHFCEDFADVTSSGVPIMHPVTRRVIGSLNLTSRQNETSPMMLPWVMELVRSIQSVFHDTTSRRERLLLNAYLAENRDARHPLIALNEQTIITNAPAARMLTAMDQAMLWEHASRTIYDKISVPLNVVLTDGTVVAVRCREVTGGTESAGAVLTVHPVSGRRAHSRSIVSAPVEELTGLVGESARWRTLCRQTAEVESGPVMIVGERGAGKAAVASALAQGRSLTVLDAVDAAADGHREWLLKLRSAMECSDSALLLRHCDSLPEALAGAVANLVRTHRRDKSLILATATRALEHDYVGPLAAEFPRVLSVPALRDRLEDLPLLLEELSRRALQQLKGAPASVQWMPDAVQALSRLAWRGNVAALESIVFQTLQGNSNGYISARDLPTDVLASASRRKLVGLEHVEANAIIEALREANGNKNAAAQSLGIARSTLYRKIRSLGIDLSRAAY